jgi:uncharacterized protein
MKPFLSVITLAVDNLERAVTFYREGLGLPTNGIIGTEFEYGAVAFFQLQPGLKLALWPRASMAHDSGLPLASASPGNLSLAHNVSSTEEVDAMMAKAARAGADVIKPATETFYGGYAGYFKDTEGHLWEIVFNPALESL